ncbi:MAG: hypothetical protein ABIP51_04155 [Bacteroidia bacterium]
MSSSFKIGDIVNLKYLGKYNKYSYKDKFSIKKFDVVNGISFVILEDLNYKKFTVLQDNVILQKNKFEQFYDKEYFI